MIRTVTWTLLLVFAMAASGLAQQKTDDAIQVDDQRQLQAPAKWIPKEPKSRMIQYEFAVPAADGDETPGRVTMMRAGGSVQANMQRWQGQFVPSTGDEQQADILQKEVAGTTIHTIDLSGTYKDRPRGPMGPVVEKSDYRMLGAIIVTPESGSYFVKLYGPANTVAAQEAAFHAMLDGLTKTAQAAE